MLLYALEYFTIIESWEHYVMWSSVYRYLIYFYFFPLEIYVKFWLPQYFSVYNNCETFSKHATCYLFALKFAGADWNIRSVAFGKFCIQIFPARIWLCVAKMTNDSVLLHGEILLMFWLNIELDYWLVFGKYKRELRWFVACELKDLLVFWIYLLLEFW